VEAFTDKNKSLPLEVLPESFARIDWNKRMQVLSFLTNAKKKHVATSSTSAINENEEMEEGKRSHKKAGTKDQPMEVEEGDAVAKEQKPSDIEVTAVIIRIGDPVPTEHPLGQVPPRFTGFSKDFGGFKLLENIRKVFAVIPGKSLQFTFDCFFFVIFSDPEKVIN
jgi:hypothetical protein